MFGNRLKYFILCVQFVISVGFSRRLSLEAVHIVRKALIKSRGLSCDPDPCDVRLGLPDVHRSHDAATCGCLTERQINRVYRSLE